MYRELNNILEITLFGNKAEFELQTIWECLTLFYSLVLLNAMVQVSLFIQPSSWSFGHNKNSHETILKEKWPITNHQCYFNFLFHMYFSQNILNDILFGKHSIYAPETENVEQSECHYFFTGKVIKPVSMTC